MIISKLMSVAFIVSITFFGPLDVHAAINARGPSGPNIVPAPSPSTEEQQAPLSDNVSGQILDSQGKPAQVQVIFKNQTETQANSIFPGRVFFPPLPLITDADGHYQLHLDDGEWIGYACGSQWGYQPLFWKVAIFNNIISSYEELSHIAPVIEEIKVSIPDIERNPSYLPPGTEISVTGNWFGCSGKVLLDVDGKQKEVTTFVNHQNRLVTFALPDFSDRGISQVKAFGIVYVNGNSRSKFASWKLHPKPQLAQGGSSTQTYTAPIISQPITPPTKVPQPPSKTAPTKRIRR